jgi:hypothetical protein
MGMGSMTGRGAGYCAGYEMPGFASNIPESLFGGGFGRGRGRGRRNMSYAAGRSRGMRFAGYGSPSYYPAPSQPTDPESEKQALKNQAQALQSELDFIKKRLSDMAPEANQGSREK